MNWQLKRQAQPTTATSTATATAFSLAKWRRLPIRDCVCECSKNHKNIVRQLNGKPAKGNAAQDQLQDCWQNWVLCAPPFLFPPATGSVTQLLTNCYISVEHWTPFEERKRALFHGSICKFRKKEQVRWECSTWLDLKLFSLHPEQDQ